MDQGPINNGYPVHTPPIVEQPQSMPAQLPQMIPQKLRRRGVFGSGIELGDLAMGAGLLATGGVGPALLGMAMSGMNRRDQAQKRNQALEDEQRARQYATEGDQRDFHQQLQLEQERLAAKAMEKTPQIKALMDAASAIGVTPGTPEFKSFAQRYLLRGNAPEVLDQRSDIAMEAIAARNRGNLDVVEMRNTAKPRGGQEKKTINGVTYYKVGGRWFDNPEGL